LFCLVVTCLALSIMAALVKGRVGEFVYISIVKGCKQENTSFSCLPFARCVWVRLCGVFL